MIRETLYQAFSLIAENKIRDLVAASRQPRKAQLAKLLNVVSTNSSSAFGHEHGFSKINSFADFRAAIPVREYEDFRPYIDRAAAGVRSVLTHDDPLMFATTSGTSGDPKYIPITSGYIREFRLTSIVSGYHLLKAYPQIAQGVTLSVVSPAEEGHTAGGIPYGAISGQLFRHEPYLIKKFISPIPYEVFLISDYETRYYTLLRIALALPISLLYTLNPSTISLLCRRLKQHALSLIEDVRKGTVNAPDRVPDQALRSIRGFLKPDPRQAEYLSELLQSNQFLPHRIWPTLGLISCWTKAAAAFYLSDFPESFGSIPICDITYGASEGRGTVFMAPEKQMLALQSHFFEFIPEDEITKINPSILLADELELGKNYFILFTTSGGLYRYNINDVVKVTGFYNQTPTLEFQYKGGNVSSFTGEKITELQVTAAMKSVENGLGMRIRFFTVIPQFRPEPHYEVWIEPDMPELSLSSLCDIDLLKIAQQFDIELCRQNIEYKTKRDSGRLGNVESVLLKPGTYESFRHHLAANGVADAQIKVSHLNPKPESRKFLEGSILSSVVETSNDSSCYTLAGETK